MVTGLMVLRKVPRSRAAIVDLELRLARRCERLHPRLSETNLAPPPPPPPPPKKKGKEEENWQKKKNVAAPCTVTVQAALHPAGPAGALQKIPGVEWHSLQVEERPAGRLAMQGPGYARAWRIRPMPDYLAAMMSCLDLVVTVDTMTAHLAGALGRPVWTLLGWVADWRWQTAGRIVPGIPARVYSGSRMRGIGSGRGKGRRRYARARFKLSRRGPIRSSESRN